MSCSLIGTCVRPDSATKVSNRSVNAGHCIGGGALRNLNGNQDVFVAKYDPTGKVLWAQRVGDKDHDQGRALAVGADGAITLAGVYHFDLALAGVTTLVSVRKPDDRAPPIDMFVARLAR